MNSYAYAYVLRVTLTEFRVSVLRPSKCYLRPTLLFTSLLAQTRTSRQTPSSLLKPRTSRKPFALKDAKLCTVRKEEDGSSSFTTTNQKPVPQVRDAHYALRDGSHNLDLNRLGHSAKNAARCITRATSVRHNRKSLRMHRRLQYS